jgi:hypothetical protein
MLVTIGGTPVGLSVKDHKLAQDHLLVIGSNCAALMDSEFNVTKHSIMQTNVYCFYNNNLVIYRNAYLSYYSIDLNHLFDIKFETIDDIHLMAIDERCDIIDLKVMVVDSRSIALAVAGPSYIHIYDHLQLPNKKLVSII